MQGITLPGTLEALSEIRAYVQQASKLANLDERRAYQLALAVDEVTTNIVMHGYEELDVTGNIDVVATVDEEALTVRISDTAPPYNPLDRPEPTDLDSPLEERQVGGLGIFLALQGVDELRYEYVDGHNHNIFVVNREVV